MLFVVQLHSCVRLFVTPWTAAYLASCPSPSPEVCLSSCPLHWWCHLAILSSDALCFFCPQSFPASGTFPMSWLFASGDQNTGASASVLPMSIQYWFPLGFVWPPCSPRDSQESSAAPQFKGINSLALCLFYSLALITIRDHWENHTLDCTDFCWQKNVSAFQQIV